MQVYRLHKALHGLKQAPRTWYTKFTSNLYQLGFKECPHNTSFFIWHASKDTIFLLLYVDNLIFTSNNNSLVFHLIFRLSQAFDMKAMGPLTYFLSMHTHQTSLSLTLSQATYAIQFLDNFLLSRCKSVKSPLVVDLQL